MQWQPTSYINLGILSWPGASHLGFTCLFWAKWRILFLPKEGCFLLLKQLSKNKKKRGGDLFCLLKLKQIQSTKHNDPLFFGCAGSLCIYHKRQNEFENLSSREQPRTSHQANHSLVICHIWALAVRFLQKVNPARVGANCTDENLCSCSGHTLAYTAYFKTY